MNILIIENDEKYLTIDQKTLKTQNHKIPLHLIDYVIISQKIDIDSSVFTELSRSSIPILFISKHSKYFSLTVPLEAKNSELKIGQYELTKQKIKIAKSIIEKKIKNHKESLQYLKSDIEIKEELNKLKNAKKIETILGIEGSFAKKYFDIYFSILPKYLHKGKRSKNPPLDPVNSILSFTYTIFYNLITSKLFAYGFDPAISYLHTPFRSHYALSSDLLEILRGDINTFCAKLFLDKHLRSEDFTKKRGIYLKPSSRRTFWKHLKPFINQTEPKIKQEIANLRKIVLTNPQENRLE